MLQRRLPTPMVAPMPTPMPTPVGQTNCKERIVEMNFCLLLLISFLKKSTYILLMLIIVSLAYPKMFHAKS
jgi:hypothetical protein